MALSGGFQDYELRREIGRGGMATVYLADDRRHDRQVAVKVLDVDVGSAVAADRFLREIRNLASVTHPHILPLLDSGRTGDSFFYVMPFVEGQTLRATMTRAGQLSLDDALRLMLEVCDALAYTHGRGAVRRIPTSYA